MMEPRVAVDAVLAGHPEAFAALVERYEGPLFACALARVYDREDARDLCQDALLRAYLSLATLKNRDAFGPWLFMILRRLCVDFLRGKWRRAEGEKKMDLFESETVSDPGRALCDRDAAVTLWQLVGRLDENSREVLALHYSQQLKIGEIALLTGLGESAVKMRLQKARALLGQNVEELQGAWGLAAAPSLSAATMALTKTAVPLKAAPLALGPIAAFLGYFGGAVWMQQKDLDRWRQHAPAGMVKELRREAPRRMAFILAVLCLVLGQPFLRAHIPHFTGFEQVLMLGLFGVVLKREFELMRPSEIARLLTSMAFFGLAAVSAAFIPGKATAFACLGGALLLQGVFISRAKMNSGNVMPGVWLMPVLKCTPMEHPRPAPVSYRQIKPWLVMLYELGLVAPPRRKDRNGIAVRLNLRAGFWSKIGWGISHSTLHADTAGTATCDITPGDYVVLARQCGPAALPGRRELAEELGRRFTAAYAVYAAGGDKDAVAACLGLSECPIDIRRSHIFRFVKYASIVAGIIGIATGLCLRLTGGDFIL